ncbi:MAG TPA: dolichyl-phosphate beta-glucosyltransferase [Trichormus sp.]|jgi:glycosyltransferase involved in cell wall biosynthesis
MQPIELSVIIPAWNEELRLPRTLSSCIEYLSAQPYRSEILVVSDGSKDKTVETAKSYQSIFPTLKVLDFPFNKGKGFGVKAGMLAATGRYRLFMDADNAVPITCVDELLEEARNGKDIVIGSRALAQSDVRSRQGFPRQQLAQLFGFLQWLVLRLPIRDTQCGFKLFNAQAAEKFFPLITYDCAYFDAELLYIAHHMGAKIAELPVTWSHDNETRLPIGVRRSVELFRKLFAIRSSFRKLQMQRDHEPARTLSTHR